MKKVYFPNLNGVRFIAAFLVILHHTEQIKWRLGYENHWDDPFIQVIGKLGVVLFFVLSGFLITYLLLYEQKNTNSISIKDFYIRRLLRIWPLYYLLIIMGLFIFNNIPFLEYSRWFSTVYDNFYLKLTLFFLFLPNLVLILYGPVPFISHSWSVGVEEQFYLIWPALIKKIKKTEFLLYGIVWGYLLVKFFAFDALKILLGANKYISVLESFWNSFSIDCMAIGGIFALYLFQKRKVLNVLFNKYLQVFTIMLLTALLILGIRFPYLHYEFYSVLFGIVLINLAANEHVVINLENRILKYLGKISYGLYMYHPLAIVITLKSLGAIGVRNPLLQYVMILFLTILIAGISYRYYEKYFIKRKVKFSKILSGENVIHDSNPNALTN